MTQQSPKRTVRRGRLFPEIAISPEEQAKKEAELEAFHQRCRPIFERLRPESIDKYYDWFISIEPDSENYFIDRERMAAVMKAFKKHPQGRFFTFRLNETGVCGRI